MELIIAFVWLFGSLVAWFAVWVLGAALGSWRRSRADIYAGAFFGWWFGLAVFIFGLIQFLSHVTLFIQQQA